MSEPSARPIPLAEVGRSAIVLTGSAFLVQAIGFVRQLFLAAEVGIDSKLDALFIGLAAPLAVTGVLTVGVRTAIVPAYAAAKDKGGSTLARQMVGSVLVWMAFAGLMVALPLWAFADAIVAVTGPGLTEAGTADDAIRYLRLLAPLTFFGAVSAVFYALCQAESMFTTMAVAMVTEPFLAVAVMLYAWDTLALDGLVFGTLAGAAVSLAIVVIGTYLRRIAPVPRLRTRGAGIRALVEHAVPLSLSAAVGQATGMFERAVASLLLPGGVSALRFGESLVRLPFAAIRPAYGTAIYPTLVKASRGTDQAALASTTLRVLRYALVFFVPLAGLTIAAAPLATAIVYDRGSFSGEDLALTAAIVAVSAPLIVIWTVQPALTAALNARRKGMILLSASVVNLVGAVMLTVVLGYLLGVVGIALATTLVSFVVVSYQALRLAGIEPTLSLRPLWHTIFKSCLAILPSMLVFGIPIWTGTVDGGLGQRVVVLVVVGVGGLASYFFIARRLGLEEARSIVAFGKDTLRRLVRRLPSRV